MGHHVGDRPLGGVRGGRDLDIVQAGDEIAETFCGRSQRLEVGRHGDDPIQPRFRRTPPNEETSDARACKLWPATMTSLTAILPAYNEAENLRHVVAELIEVTRPLFCDAKVLIVDDGSTDDTPRVARELCGEMPEVGYVRLRRNLGKSQALKAGMERADSDLVLLIDADGQDDPAAIPDLLAALDAGNDLATGRRAAPAIAS